VTRGGGKKEKPDRGYPLDPKQGKDWSAADEQKNQQMKRIKNAVQATATARGREKKKKESKLHVQGKKLVPSSVRQDVQTPRSKRRKGWLARLPDEIRVEEGRGRPDRARGERVAQRAECAAFRRGRGEWGAGKGKKEK